MKHCIHATQPLGPLVVLCANAEANKLFGQRAHVFNCDICGFRQPDPTSAVTIADAPDRGFGLGDLVEKIVKPIARFINSDCLDEKEDLVAGSPCAKGRDALNRIGRRITTATGTVALPGTTTATGTVALPDGGRP